MDNRSQLIPGVSFPNIARRFSRLFLNFLQSRIVIRFTNLIDNEVKWVQNKRTLGRLQRHGENCSISMPVVIRGPEKIRFGHRVTVSPYVHFWGQGGIEIGDDTMIASHVAITSLSHDQNSKSNYNKTITQSPIVVGKNVWIGSHSIILPGVSIGNNSIIAAGAVVTKDVPADSVFAGIPARLIRKL